VGRVKWPSRDVHLDVEGRQIRMVARTWGGRGRGGRVGISIYRVDGTLRGGTPLLDFLFSEAQTVAMFTMTMFSEEHAFLKRL
jgi:hypothetical protein